MDFSKLRHRAIFLKPLDKRLNSMNENVPVWIPFVLGVSRTGVLTGEFSLFSISA